MGKVKKSSTTEKKPRGKNFSLQETETLIENIQNHKAYLFGSFSSVVTDEGKKKLWVEILNKVNAHNVAPRSVVQIQKKWSDYASRTKLKAASIKRSLAKTGNPEATPELTPIEQKAIDILGNTAIYGIEEGGEAGLSAQATQDEPHEEAHVDAATSQEDSGSEPDMGEDEEEMITDVDTEQVVMVIPSTSTHPLASTSTHPHTSTHHDGSRIKPVSKKKRSTTLDDPSVNLIEIEQQILATMRAQLGVQERIATSLERIANTMEARDRRNDPAILDPVITQANNGIFMSL